MKPHKTVVFLGDGMADEPIAELGHRTPLQAANTHHMDAIARLGRSGTMLTLPEGFPTSSDVANMSVLGCDLATELCGRGPLEAASQGIPLGPNDIAFRMNLVTVDADGILRDFSGGHIAQADAEEAIRLLNDALGTGSIRFYPGVSYRNLLVLSGPEYSAEISYDKPDDNHGQPVAKHLPRTKSTEGQHTAAVLRDLIARAADVLKGRAANGIWPWSGGKAGAIHNICQRYGIRAAVISAVDVINGLGRCMGMDVIKVPGATGYIDTNYEGKADAALKALADGYDFVYVHVEAIDEVSHAQDLALKMKAIEDFDRRLVGRVMDGAGPAVAYCVLPDHPVPLALGKHTRTPVPVAVYQPGVGPDDVQTFDESAARHGALGHLKGSALMDLLLK
ncbi:MAG TPA: cofactor-independent phosphoglycerate mutase [Kiritimatiellia bacterium]|nr:cofactor-independent phosphoglycerate mutase [Kiritimatiellia bacterium]HRU71089.1 cofactor-independent phosphoglycerate mutase [Kiritimatiellia bacterium]